MVEALECEGMDLLNDELVLGSSILLTLAGGVTVSCLHMRRARRMRRHDAAYSLTCHACGSSLAV